MRGRSRVCERLHRMAEHYAMLTGRPSYQYGGKYLVDGGAMLYCFAGGVFFSQPSAALEYMAQLIREAQERAVAVADTEAIIVVKGRG